MSATGETITAMRKRLSQGGGEKNRAKLVESKKLFARDRIELLCDKGSFIEDGLFANCLAEGLAADGVVTGLGKIDGKTVAIAANDSTVKAGSWGARTVEKILRLQETAERLQVPVFYLVDSAGARITDQVEMFPGRRGAGRIFFNQANFSGRFPQICILFGPSAAGGAYIPAFCDIVIMVEGNASMYLGSPRMAEAVIGEKVTLEEMGGARMHCTTSGCGDYLAPDEKSAIALAKKYLSYMPKDFVSGVSAIAPTAPEISADKLAGLIPEAQNRAYDMRQVLKGVVDKDSLFEVKELYAKEVVTAFARIEGRAVGIVANQPMVKGGVLFVESSNKAARFMQICQSYQLPILFFADVPGYMIGSKVEKEGMIRAGAKMIHSMSTATVPKICVVVRKAFGAGLYAMSGPAFGSDCVIALPTAKIAVMGAEPAVNAVYYNKMEAMSPEEKKSFFAKKVEEYEKDVDIHRLANELVIDDMIEASDLRQSLVQRLGYYGLKNSPRTRHYPIMPM